jgi:RNA polymerase sigma factor (sigma-70 family)
MSNLALAVPPVARDDDRALAVRVGRGEAAAFETLMRRYNRRLFRLARSTLRNDSEAEDALQEAWVLAYRRIGQFRGDAALITWLSRLVLNECLGRLRRAARRDNVVPIVALRDDQEADMMAPSNADAPDTAAERAQVRRLIERKLDELPAAFRTVFVLRCVEELTVEETAACLGLPDATVRSRHFRARSMLREALARELDGAERDLYDFGGWRCDRVVHKVLRRIGALDGTP